VSIRIGPRTFPTKAAAEKHIREMFWRYPAMGALAGEDLEFVLALIDIHPSRTHIIDCGIRTVHIQPVPFHEHDQRRFLVRRTDSSIRDFSWRNALSPKSDERKLAGILRHLIADQKNAFRDAHFRGLCETCGKTIQRGNCHVDHAHPVTFERLMAGWLKSEYVTVADVAIVRRRGYEQHSYLEDSALARSWIEYHEINARLRCVCQKCNLSTLRATSPGKARDDK